MSNIIKDVIKLAEQFTANPQYVFIDEKRLGEVAEMIKDIIPAKSWGGPKIPIPVNAVSETPSIVLYELIANSINYAYWYGRSDIRPNGSDANKMHKTLDLVFGSVTPPMVALTDEYCKAIINEFIQRLTMERFPMLQQRVVHLKELVEEVEESWTPYDVYLVKPGRCKALLFSIAMARDIDAKAESLTWWMEELIKTFPGYASDMFLKRASLFFMMLHRRGGWFKSEIKDLHIPADYQIPKILRYLNVLKYSLGLSCDISAGDLIPAGSLAECEIRASTIVAAQKIAELVGVTAVQIDDYLWLNRKMTSDPFHLTITTDY